MPEGLTGFLRPASVAIIGASDDPTRIGGRPVRYLLDSGYAGAILPVNPNRTTIQGLPAFPSVDDLPFVPDVAVVAVGRDQVPSIVRASGRRGIRHAIVFAAGFAETGSQGAAIQQELAAAAASTGIRLLGPNSNGAISVEARTPLALTPIVGAGLPPLGGLAVATQSAAVGSTWLRRMQEQRIGLRHWVHTGNEVDLGLADVLEAYLADVHVRTILVVLEQWRAPHRLPGILEAIERSAARVVILPLGRTPAGRDAAMSHTGGLVNRHADVVAGAARQVGAFVARTLGEAFDLATTMDVVKAVGPRIGILTSSGGFGVLLADAFAGAGFSLPSFPEALQRRWLARVPYCSPVNPVDVTAQVVNEPGLFGAFATEMVESECIDVLVAFLPHATVGDARTTALKELAAPARVRGVAVVGVGWIPDDVTADLRRGGVVVFREPDQAASALAAIAASRRDSVVANLTSPQHLQLSEHDLQHDVGGLSDELAVKAVLREAGIDVVADVIVDTPAAASAVADRMGYPVALKRIRSGIGHKAADDGVALHLADPAMVEAAATHLFAAARPGDRVILEPMVLGDEVFLSATRDDVFGTLVILGPGGGDVESAPAIAYRRAPVDDGQVAGMIDEVGLGAIFHRGRRRDAIARLDAIATVLVAVLAARPRLRSIELNPVIVTPDGRAVVVDALGAWA